MPPKSSKDNKGLTDATEADNPDFAHSDEIAQAMMEKGLWEEFWRWLLIQGHMDKFVETLVTPPLLKQAIIAWAALRTLGHDELAKEVGG